MDVYSVYQNCLDKTNKDEGGYFSADLYNRFSWLGQLRLVDWLTGDINAIEPPQYMAVQKNRDWISDFIVKYPAQVQDGIIAKPDDYYVWDNAYKINGAKTDTCDEDCDGDEDEIIIVDDIPITLLDNSKFKLRVNTWIKSLKPNIKKPIAKMIGNNIEFYPKDLGSVAVEYVRYPVMANLVMKLDTTYNDEVYDKAASTQFEWGEYARTILVWYIVNEFQDHISNPLGKQMNQATPKLSRQ